MHHRQPAHFLRGQMKLHADENFLLKSRRIERRAPHQLQRRMSSGEAEQIISRDETLAKQLHIERTPTIFVNGVRIRSVHSQQDVESLIERASKDR